jgi:transposase-like protein
MRARDFKHLLTLSSKLTPCQREQLIAHLGTDLALERAAVIVQGEMSQQPGCPSCQVQHVARNGQTGGLRRDKCRGCGVTFNALTASAGATIVTPCPPNYSP